MALTKKQQAELDTLQADLRDARALSWPVFPCPKPMPPPTEFGKLVAGWAINEYSARVVQEWQDSGCSYSNPEGKNGSRDRRDLYATEADACLTLIHKLARNYAKHLSRLYAQAGWLPVPEPSAAGAGPKETR